MLKEGTLVGGRYRIVSLVGSGGMADVYNAKDERLNRSVAIKILKEEYSSDRNFVVKFRGEAQSAAGLSHPNIVNVYDVGEEDGLYYIVMELVEGITLKKFIERKGKLELREAVGIAVQIAQGMEAAHANHIIHRDIKPQNIIISKEGKVKVTDFGIAKAATSNTIAAGQAIGSVHYISPEQARGGYSDEKSDIYSLGVTLYEMLSGKMPFAADNTVSVALLHIQEEAVPLRELDPDIPASIEKIVQKCMQKKPERRYLTATELIKDLKKSISEPEGDFVKIEQAAATDSPTINISGEELKRIRSARYPEERERSRTSSHTKDKKEVSLKDEDDEMDPKMERLILIGGIAAIVVLAAVIIVLVVKGFNLFGRTHEENPPLTSSVSSVDSQVKQSSSGVASSGVSSKASAFVVPDIKGRTLAEAIGLLNEAKIGSYRYDFENSKEVKKDYVIDVKPEAGTEIKENEEVVIVVSNGEEVTRVPNLENISKEAAVTTLEGMKFKVSVEEDFSDTVPEGKVIGTKPVALTELKEGDAVTLIVSKGPEAKKVKVPSVTGKTEAEAVKELSDAGLKSKVSNKYSDTVEKGLVISQSMPEGREVNENSTIAITVSSGPEVKVTYLASVSIDENPFADEGESGLVEIRMDQDGVTKTIYSETVSYSDFPILIDNIKGSSEKEAICYMYVDGELYTDKVWRITSWEKSEE